MRIKPEQAEYKLTNYYLERKSIDYEGFDD